MSRSKKFVKNTLTTGMLQVITMITGFILPRIMLSIYGSEVNGLVSSISQLIAYLTLVEAGLSGATIYSLYKPLAENNHYNINRILVAAKKFYYKAGYLFVGLVVGLAFLYPLFLKTESLNSIEITFLFVILGMNGILEFFTLAKYRALLTADQKTYVISLASIVQVVLNTLIVVVLSYMGVSIIIVRLVALASIFIRTIILWGYCRRKYKYIDFSVEPDNSALEKRWDALYMQIIGVIHTGTPIILSTFILTFNDVSIYSIYYIVINGLNSILSIFISGLSASFGDLIIRGEKETFKKSFQQFEYVYYATITIIYSITMIAYIPFIKVYTEGADINYIYPTLAMLMTINGYFYNLKTPFGMLTIASGKYKESRVQITIQGLIEIILGIIFAILWGLNGIIIASIVSNVYRDIDFIFFAPKHLTKYSFASSLKLWGRSILTIIIVFIISKLIPNEFVDNYITWIQYVMVISVISVITTLLVNVIIDKNQFKEVYLRIKSIFTRGR